MKKSEDQDKITGLFAQKLRNIFGKNLVTIYWFGSRARGRGRTDSDYDLMVETKTELTESQRDAIADIAVDITADHGVMLDIHYYTTNDINNPPFSRSPFVRSVLEEGVRICQ